MMKKFTHNDYEAALVHAERTVEETIQQLVEDGVPLVFVINAIWHLAVEVPSITRLSELDKRRHIQSVQSFVDMYPYL